MKKLLDEFKEFINRGNVMDLAVAAPIVRGVRQSGKVRIAALCKQWVWPAAFC